MSPATATAATPAQIATRRLGAVSRKSDKAAMPDTANRYSIPNQK